jgi:hypothetical protein
MHGKRVEIAPHFDRWMQGDRYGRIISSRGTLPSGDPAVIYVKMDRSGKTIHLSLTDVTFV